MISISEIFSRKKPFFAILGFLLIAVVILLSFILLRENFSRQRDLLGANLAYVEGLVEYRGPGGDWEKAVDAGVSLFEGYTIEVVGEGKAIINLDDGSAVRLNSDSSVTLESMDPQHIVITNNWGAVYARVVELARTFEVKTAAATYVSLGTAYKSMNEEDTKGVEVYQGRVKVDGVVKDGEVVVEEGKKYFLLSGSDADAENVVTELVLEEIKDDGFVLWNKEQDEAFEEFRDKMGVLQDLTAPELSVTSPGEEQSETESESVVVEGTTEAGASVYINGVEVENDGGTFSQTASLKVGKNTIKIMAIDRAGNKAVVERVVTRKELAPPVSSPGPQVYINLSGTGVDNGVRFTWTVSGVDVSKGFKLVKSTSINPTYPNNAYKYVSSSEESYTWKIADGKTYYFRICQYLGGTCGTYSNNVQLTVPNNPCGGVTSITLSDLGGGKVEWGVVGCVENGFKLIWSKTSGPTYPPRKGLDKASWKSSDTRSATISAFDGSGTYYVRVCEYLSGACGKYSNEISVTL